MKGLFAQACQVVNRLVEVEIAGIEPDEDRDLTLIDVPPKAIEPPLHMGKLRVAFSAEHAAFTNVINVPFLHIAVQMDDWEIRCGRAGIVGVVEGLSLFVRGLSRNFKRVIVICRVDRLPGGSVTDRPYQRLHWKR